MSKQAVRFVSGIADLAEGHDGFILDQWGVLHDGSNAYPGVIETIARLAALGKTLVLLSNSGRRAALNREGLASMGFDTGLFAGIITSGEAAWQGMRDGTDPAFSGLGRRCLLFTRGGDRMVVEGLDLDMVESPEAADFIMMSGTDGSREKLGDYESALSVAAKRGLPMICSNPDMIGVTAFGHQLAPGTVARRYEQLGGKVAYIGKPHPPIYRICLATFAGMDRRRIVAVGDSMQHDIRGAAGMDIDTALVAAGLHADAFPADAGEDVHRAGLDELAEHYGVSPDWVVPTFSW